MSFDVAAEAYDRFMGRYSLLSVSLQHPSFEEWWEPFTRGVGPAGSYVAGLDSERRADLREYCRSRLPIAPFVLTARAWATRGVP